MMEKMTELHRRPREPRPHKPLWRLWAKSIGQKTGLGDYEADQIAWIRTIVVGINLVTCFFIIAGIIRHW